MTLLFIAKLNVLPPQIPLYYSRPGSDQQIVQTYYVFLLPLISLIFITANKFFSASILKEEFAQIIAYIQSISIVLMTFYIFVKVILLVS